LDDDDDDDYDDANSAHRVADLEDQLG